MEECQPIPADASCAVVYRSTWGTRLLHFVRRWSLSLFACFMAIAIVGFVFGNDLIVVCIAMIAGLFVGVFIFALCSRSYLTKMQLTEEHCTFGRRPFHHVIPWEDVMLVQVEHPDGTVGDEVKLSIHTRHRHLVIWLAAEDAAACFDTMRELASHAAAAIGEDDYVLPVDETGDEAVRAASVLVLRRRARNSTRASVGLGAWGLLILALALSNGITFPDDILAILFISSMTGLSISCAGYAHRNRRMADAIEAGELDILPVEDDDGKVPVFEQRDSED